MKKYSIMLKDLYASIWIRAERYEIANVNDALGNPCTKLSFFIGDNVVFYISTSIIESFKYWPLLSDAKEIQL